MRLSRFCLPLLLLTPVLSPARADDNFPLGPDSKPQPGVPKGEVIHDTFAASKIFPGTTRDYWVYVPAEYSPEKPACLYVNQDGIQFDAPTVFDNLIHKKEMPVTIGVFVTPGVVKAPSSGALDRFNRSYEYDAVNDNYVRFLLDELLPEVERKKTSDGRAVRLSHDGNDHAIGGTSSGAVCAFTAAWERPDAFRRVFSGIGTYVGLRGGDRYATLLRKYEPKPIRVFLQDGSNDQNIYAGDWWMANQTMERALTFAGYEVRHEWGEGSHNGNHASALFPDAMRWLWKDWAQPVWAGRSRNETLNDLLISGEDWEAVEARPAAGTASDANGAWLLNGLMKGEAQTYGPDGRLYTLASGNGALSASDGQGKRKSIAGGLRGHDLVVAHNGNVYVTQPDGKGGAGTVYLIATNGKKTAVDTGLLSPSGITLSPDQSLLYVADRPTHWVYSYQIRPDGTLQHKQQYYYLHVPDNAEDSGAESMAVDRDGRLYVATRMGVQVCDQAGRVNAILPVPGGGAVTRLAFGGENSDTLYATSGGTIYARRLKVRGAQPWLEPVKPAPPRL